MSFAILNDDENASASQVKRTLFVGGLADEVTESVLRSAFIPFGQITDVVIPNTVALQSDKSRRFGFVEFEDPEDAAAAKDNMHESEMFGRVIYVRIADTNKAPLTSSRAVWAMSETYQDADKAEGDAKDEAPAQEAS